MTNDYDKLKQEEAEKSEHLQELMLVSNKLKNSNPFFDNKLINSTINTKKNPINNTPKDNFLNNTKNNNNRNNRHSISDTDRRIDNICDYYDELQYNLDYFNSEQRDNETVLNNNNSIKNFQEHLYQHQLSSKLRKNLLNRKLIDHRINKYDKRGGVNGMNLMGQETSDKSVLSSIISSMTIPTLHFHLILSLTMVILTHQCPHYMYVL